MTMKTVPNTSSVASREYHDAYAAHYSARDLPLAMRLYEKLLASYPETQEGKFSRMQIRNIVNSVVPKQELLDAEIRLARTHFE